MGNERSQNNFPEKPNPEFLGAQEFSAYINEVLEEERARIARDMHDGLGQQLTALKMDLDDLQRSAPSLQHKLKEMMAFTDEIIDTVRKISLELRPSVLDDLGLLAAMVLRTVE